MRNLLLSIVILIYGLPALAISKECVSVIPGYKVIPKSVYPFVIGKKEACFFAFYTDNPRIGGNGNTNDFSIWYGYYEKNPSKVEVFPKPSDMFWSSVCHLDAVSFLDMNNDGIRDVTVIGSCDEQNEIKYRFPFLFIFQNEKYVLKEEVYSNLYGFINLTVADVKAYIKNPGQTYKTLRNRYSSKHRE